MAAGLRKPKDCVGASAGTLLSVKGVGHYSKKKLEDYWDSWLVGLSALGYIDDTVDPGIENGADTYLVEYCTTDFDGSVIVGTGMLGMPRTIWQSPTVMYAHGTAVTRTDTPSNPNVDEVFDGPTPMVIFAGHGYIYLAPDLTGFGGSAAERHRYFHAETSAASELDMLHAVESWLPYCLWSDGRLFNMGFSQGGQTALAFAEAAEADGVDIEGTAVVGTVAEPEAWFAGLLDEVENPYLQLYAADLVVSYDDVYGDLYGGDPSEAFAAPYDATVEGLFDMNHAFFEVVEGLPGSSAELFTPDFYAAAQDPGSTLRTHLAENAVDDVCLDGPIAMYHSIGDDEVPFPLAESARDALAGCNDVELVEWPELDHLNTWHEVLPVARDWFDAL
ncbi:MAG: hypothetical protein ABMB14_02730 [Myxococcota bacterium]